MLDGIVTNAHALKPFFDVTLCDKNDKPLAWSKGLVYNTNYPTFQFEVDEQEAGASRAYTGWHMPEAFSISMYETRKRELEKYLLDWMFGGSGIFDLNNSTFRTAGATSHIYRNVVFRTTYYKKGSEKMTSTNVYRVALRGYTVDNYDYSTGGAVSFTLDLPIKEYNKPDFG